MAQHTYKPVGKGSQLIVGLTADEAFWSVNEVTEFDGIDFKILRVKKLFVSGLTVYQYEVSELQPVSGLKEVLENILEDLQGLI